MAEKTCAACDCELEANAFKVTVAGQAIDVRYEDGAWVPGEGGVRR